MKINIYHIDFNQKNNKASAAAPDYRQKLGQWLGK